MKKKKKKKKGFKAPIKDGNYDFDREHDKEFLRESAKKLQKEVLSLRLTVMLLTLKNTLYKEIKSKLTGELLVLRAKIFDSKQEKKKKLEEIKKLTKKKKVCLIHNVNENKEVLETYQKENLKLSVQEEKHELNSKTCPHCGKEELSELENLFEESTEYDTYVTRYVLKRHQRKKYKCKNCKKITTAKCPKKLKPGAQFSAQMATQIVCDKFERHIPLERQRKQMKKSGLDVSVKTLFSITDHLYQLLRPLEEMNRQDILKGKYLCIDESPMTFYNPSKSRGYMWSMSNHIGAFYQFEPTRSGKVAAEMLRGFKGSVISDGYGGYNFLDNQEGIDHGNCWSHMRRYFIHAMEEDKKAGEVVDMIDALYEIEHEAQSFEELKVLRDTRSRKIYKDIEDWVKRNESAYLPSTLTGKAIQYFLNKKEILARFLDNEYLPIDNNTAKRRQRVPVMGRKNYLYFRSINGADMGAFYYSIIETCRTDGLDPTTYLLEMALRRLDSKELESPYQYASRLKKQILSELHQEMESLKDRS